MKLTFRRADLKLTRTWRISSGLGGHGANSCGVVFVEVSDDHGHHGLGEGAPCARYAETVETVERFLKKVDPTRLSFDDLAGSQQHLESLASGNYTAKCALDLALLDGAAKAAQQPIYQYLQLGFTENKHVTSFSIGIDRPEVIRDKVRDAKAYPVLKLKLGSPEDKTNFAALREIAPAKPIRVDANEAWKTKEEALRQIEWLHRGGGVQFVEQPMPAATSVRDWVWLKERSPLPIFGDESYHHAGEVAAAAECFHGVNVKLVKSGGISRAYDALQAARRAGLQTMIGCMIESSVLISAAAHLAELADHLDLDGNLLISNDPYCGATTDQGVLSFAKAPEKFGLRVTAQPTRAHRLRNAPSRNQGVEQSLLPPVQLRGFG